MPSTSTAVSGVARILILSFAAALSWVSRWYMHPDGVSYIDIARAYIDGRFPDALNAYWSPLYSWIIVPFLALSRKGGSEFLVVHFANVLICAAALVAFEFFWRELREATGQAVSPAWQVTGYVLFGAATFALVRIERVGPDLLASAALYWIVGLLLAIRSRGAVPRRMALLGFAMGLGYLAKAAMFPVSIAILLLTPFAIAGTAWERIRRCLLPAVAFGAVAVPWTALISARQGYPTFGDAGALNYAWMVNGVPAMHWMGIPAAGTPVHPPILISEHPPVYAFPKFESASYPLWYDPSYWNAGVSPSRDWNTLGGLATLNLHKVGYLVLVTFLPLTAMAILRIAESGIRKWSARFLDLWLVWVPALLLLLAYLPLTVERRHIGAALVLIWAAGMAGSLDRPTRWRKLFSVLGMVLLGLTIGQVARIAIAGAVESSKRHPDMEARALWATGIRSGDAIAVLGSGYSAFWAKAGQFRIVADIPDSPDTELWFHHRRMQSQLPASAALEFWNSTESRKQEIYRDLRNIGVRAIIATTKAPEMDANWMAAGSTGLYVRLLEE